MNSSKSAGNTNLLLALTILGMLSILKRLEKMPDPAIICGAIESRAWSVVGYPSLEEFLTKETLLPEDLIQEVCFKVKHWPAEIA